jgi:hypothetical protein
MVHGVRPAESNRKQSCGDDRDERGLEGQKHDGQDEGYDRSAKHEHQPDAEAQKHSSEVVREIENIACVLADDR